MALKKKITKLEEVPENARGAYVKQADGSYLLDAEPDDGDEPDDKPEPVANKVNKELRAKNTKLQEELNAISEKFKDVDPEQYSRLLGIVNGIEDEKELADFKAGKLTFAQLKQNAQKAVRDTYQKQLDAANKERDKASEAAKLWLGHFTKLKVGAAIRDGARAAKINLLPAAEDDATAFALALGATVDDKGEPALVNSKGEPITSRGGKAYETWAEVAQDLMESRPYYFESGQGGGSKPGAGGGRRTSKEPTVDAQGRYIMDSEARKQAIANRS